MKINSVTTQKTHAPAFKGASEQVVAEQLRRTQNMFKHVAKSDYALTGLNVNNMEQTMGVMKAVLDNKAATVIQASAGAVKYAGAMMKHLFAGASDMVSAARGGQIGAEFIPNLDHGKKMEVFAPFVDMIAENPKFKYKMAMIDASSLPFDDNVKLTQEAVKYAHGKGVAVEAELGAVDAGVNKEVYEEASPKEKMQMITDVVKTLNPTITNIFLGGLEGNAEKAVKKGLSEGNLPEHLLNLSEQEQHHVNKALDAATQKLRFTDPKEAAEFIKKTGADLLAGSFGTSHGVNKKNLTPLQTDRMIEVQQEMRNAKIIGQNELFPIVLHGASSSPADIIEKANAHVVIRRDIAETLSKGGVLNPEQMKDLSHSMQKIKGNAISEEEISAAIKMKGTGLAKVNVDSDQRSAVKGAVMQAMHDKPTDPDPRTYLGVIKDSAIPEVTARKLKMVGSVGKADELNAIS